MGWNYPLGSVSLLNSADPSRFRNVDMEQANVCCLHDLYIASTICELTVVDIEFRSRVVSIYSIILTLGGSVNLFYIKTWFIYTYSMFFKFNLWYAYSFHLHSTCSLYFFTSHIIPSIHFRSFQWRCVYLWLSLYVYIYIHVLWINNWQNKWI